MAKNTSTSSNLSPAVVDQVKAALSEIASLAYAAKQLSIESSMQTGGDPALGALVGACQVLAEKIGFIADNCSEKINGGVHIGGAIEWMMPPRYRDNESKQSDPVTA